MSVEINQENSTIKVRVIYIRKCGEGDINQENETYHLIKHKASMYLVLVGLFFLFDFLLSQNKHASFFEEIEFSKHRLIYILIFLLLAATNLIYHYFRLKNRKEKIPSQDSEEYYLLLVKEYNRYERYVQLAEKKLDMLKEISPIIVTFVFLQGLIEKIISVSIQMEFSEILGFVIVLFYVFMYMEAWHTYKLDSHYLYKYKDMMFEYEEKKKDDT